MTEQELLNQVMAWLHSKGVMAWRNNTGGVFDPEKKTFRRPSKWSRNGIPDIMMIINGRAVYCELKRPHSGPRARKEETLFNMLSDAQKSFLADCRTNGGVCFVADSLDTVIKNIEPLLTKEVFH